MPRSFIALLVALYVAGVFGCSDSEGQGSDAEHDAGADSFPDSSTGADVSTGADADIDAGADTGPADASTDTSSSADADADTEASTDASTGADAEADASTSEDAADTGAPVDASGDVDDGGEANDACGCPPGQHCTGLGGCAPDAAPLGGFCGTTATCASSDPSFSSCVREQCLSNTCLGFLGSALLLRTVCTTPCQIYQDDNANGVNDINAPLDDCLPSDLVDGPAGSSLRCVNFAPPGHSVEAYCAPGSEFEPCETTVDCPPGEICDITSIGGELALRCVAGYAQNASWDATVVDLGASCNEDASLGPRVVCGAGLCVEGFCSRFCATDADCDTTLTDPGAGCLEGACTGDPTRTCSVDADCSLAACAHDVVLPGAPSLTLDLCLPQP